MSRSPGRIRPEELRAVCQAGKDRDPAWYRVHRRLSIHITARLLHTPVRLNHVSLAMMAMGLVAAALFSAADVRIAVFGLLAGYLSFLLDKVDGELARYRGQASVMGVLLDRFHHRLVEPLVFLALGWRAQQATDSAVPLVAALATMLAANIVEETQQLPAFIAAKHARATRQWPATTAAGPSPALERVAAVMRALKTFRMYLTVLPLAVLALVLEAWTGRSVTTGYLVLSAVALWVYVLFQSWYYAYGQLDAELAALVRELPPLPAREPLDTPVPARIPGSPEPAPPSSAPGPGPERRRSSDAASNASRVAIVLLLPLVLAASPARAGDYYVDVTNPAASAAGPGTPTKPYNTISAALAAHAAPGDQILVKPGVYRETVTVPASGSPGAPLVIRALGSPVVLECAEDYSSTAMWTPNVGDVWLASSVTWSPKQVTADGLRLTASKGTISTMPPNTFRYVAGAGLYVNLGSGNPGLRRLLVGKRGSAFVLNGRSWVTIDGFTIQNADDRAISLSPNSNDVEILRNSVTYSLKYGIYVSGSQRVHIAGNATFDNANHGIMMTGGSNDCLIEDNDSYRNAIPGTRAANGLYLYGCNRNVIRRNKWHENQDTGQHLQSGSADNLSYNNLSWNNGDHGYDHLGATGTRHWNDVAYGNYKDGFSIEGISTGTELHNCIAVDNGLTTNEFDLWVEGTSQPGFVSNDNIFWNSTSQAPIKYGTTLYTKLVTYVLASGQDTRSQQSDPLFVSPATGNFHLRPGSSAIDNADASDPSWPVTDFEGNPRVDDDNVPDAGMGLVPYADRGAYEYQPSGLPPVASLTAEPAVATAPANINLDASGSYDPDGSIVSYYFDFGDGVSAGPQFGPIATHNYTYGTYQAVVTVTDDQGYTGTATTTIVANRAPVALMTAEPVSGRAPLTVAFDASASLDGDGAIASYRFDFGDGSTLGPQATPTATHLYGTGNYLARVRVTDDRGATDTLDVPITINVGPPNTPPTAMLVATPSSGLAPLSVTLDASGSSDPDGGIVSYRFVLGDGTTVGPQASPTVTHVYGGGSYTVMVTVTDSDGATASRTTSVFANTPNLAPNGVIVTPAANATVYAGQSVTFTSTANDPDGNVPITSNWFFGGVAPVSTLANPGAVVFPDPGTYTVTLTVYDALGLADPTPDSRIVTVLPPDTSVAADQVHWTPQGPTAVTLDWRGPVGTLRWGLTSDYGQVAVGQTPAPLPWSSPGPFWEVRLTGLAPNTTYHYSIAGGPDHEFRTAPVRGSSGFTVMAGGDIGDAAIYPPVAGVHALIASQTPSFVLALGDLSYANTNGVAACDRFFNDIMAWSQDAGTMPIWGNHEWESVGDDLRNYKGRFELPNAQTTPGIAPPNDGGEDWYWFDHGNVRFIAYPEAFDGAWDDWLPRARALMDSAQADPAIAFIVTFGHRPAYSSGRHPGETRLQGYLDQLGASHPKYVLNLNGHSHDYERSLPQSGVVHVTTGAMGSPLGYEAGACKWFGGCPPPSWSAYRIFHSGALRLRFTAGGIEGAFLAGPPQTGEDVSVAPGTVLDSFVIGVPSPDQAPVVVAPAAAGSSEGGTVTVEVTASDPEGDVIQTLTADLSRLPAGHDAVFTVAPDRRSGVLVWHPNFGEAGDYAVTFTASNLLAGSATTTVTVSDQDRPPVVATPDTAYTVAEGGTLTIPVTVADPDGDAIASLAMGLVPAPPGAPPAFTPSPSNSSGTFAWTPDYADSGSYALTFTATNSLQGARTVAVRVANTDRAPVLSVPTTLVATEGQTVDLSFGVADPDGDAIASLTADLGQLPAGHDATFTAAPDGLSGQLRWTPQPEDSGVFHVVFTASNALVTNADLAISVNHTDHPPVLVAPDTLVVAEGAPLVFGVSVSDPDSSSIASFSADLSALPAGSGATFVTTADHRNGTFQWTPGFTHAGTYAVRWLANNALSDSAVTVLRVIDVDRAPVVAAPPTVSVSAGTMLSLDVAASDPDGDPIAAFIALLGGLPAGNNATFTAAADNRSGVLRWTPAATDTGVYPVSFQAINTLSGSGATQITVRAPNLAPTAAVVVTPVSGNAPLTVTANASSSSDPEGNILSYRFDFGDGTIVGPQASATAAHTYGAGSWTLSVTVTDTHGALNSVTAKVTVAGAGPGPNLCANSSFETNTNGWNSYSGSSYTRVAGGFDGASALQVTGPATLSSFGINDSPNWVASVAGTGARYRFAAWVRSATATGAAKLQVREYLAGVKIGGTTFSVPVTLSPDWQLVIVEHVTQSSGSTLDFQVYETPQVPGETFLVDNIGIWLVPAGEPPILLTGPTAPEAEAEAAPVLEFGARMVPSVAHGDATLRFTTTRRGPVRVSLFDASGRLVRTLLDEPDMAPGLHDLNVNGRGDRGDRLGSGLYFYRVQAAERTASGRVVFVR